MGRILESAVMKAERKLLHFTFSSPMLSVNKYMHLCTFHFLKVLYDGLGNIRWGWFTSTFFLISSFNKPSLKNIKNNGSYHATLAHDISNESYPLLIYHIHNIINLRLYYENIHFIRKTKRFFMDYLSSVTYHFKILFSYLWAKTDVWKIEIK